MPDAPGASVCFGSSGSSTAVTVTASQTAAQIALGGKNYTVSGSGDLVLDGNGAAAGITVTSGKETIFTPLTLDSNVVLAIGNPADSLSLDGAIGGGGSLTKSGSGTLVLGGSNTYTGGTVVTGGLLILGSAGAIANGTALTVGDDAAFTHSLLAAPTADSLLSCRPAVSPILAVPEPGTWTLLAVTLSAAAACQCVRNLRYCARRKGSR